MRESFRFKINEVFRKNKEFLFRKAATLTSDVVCLAPSLSAYVSLKPLCE